jgi:hypothetical protein
MAMDAHIQKQVEYLLDDQLPNIRAAFEEAIKAVCADPVRWFFNLELLAARGTKVATSTRRDSLLRDGDRAASGD